MSISGVSSDIDRPEEGVELEVVALQARTVPVVSAYTVGFRNHFCSPSKPAWNNGIPTKSTYVQHSVAREVYGLCSATSSLGVPDDQNSYSQLCWPFLSCSS